MAMLITQEYMDKNVVKPMKDLKEKIELSLSNTALLVREFDKVMKNLKKVK